jgi:hypothetical protein
MRSLLSCAVVAGLVGGCGPGAPGKYLDGFNPPPPDTGQIEIVGPILHGMIASGANINLCSYLDSPFAVDTDVTGFNVYQSAGGHHAVLYGARIPRPAGTHVCTDDDMLNATYIAGGGADNASAAFHGTPPGLSFRVKGGSQVFLYTHWINATTHDIDGQAVVHMSAQPPSANTVPADLFTNADTTFSVPAGMKATTSTTCVVQQDLQFFFFAGHEHRWGSHVLIERLDGGSATTLYQTDWLPEYETNPPVNNYTKDAPLVFKAGQGMRVTCEHDNTGSTTPLGFPTEMCVAFGFYFPGHGEIDCVDGAWPQ